MSMAEAGANPIAAENPFDWPFFGLQDDVRRTLGDARARGVRTVLATLHGVVGGAPRGAGAQMVFLEDALVGFLSGGCIEADLALNAKRVMGQQRSERLVYGEGGPMDIQLPCGSRIEVLLEPIDPNDAAVARLLELTEERRPALWLTDGDERACVLPGETGKLAAKLRPVAAIAAASQQICGHVQSPFSMFRAFAPQRRLIAIGSDPIALAVIRLATEAGFETVLIRPNGPETCPLPGVRYYRSDVADAISASRPDRWTAVAVLTHDLADEHAALTAALASEAGYVGALGSRRRMPERNARLASSGVASTAIGRVHAPIGLAIGGKSPWDIAVSVIAEVVAELDAARRDAGPPGSIPASATVNRRY